MAGGEGGQGYESNWFMDSGAMNQDVSRGRKDRESNSLTVPEGYESRCSMEGQGYESNWFMDSETMNQNWCMDSEAMHQNWCMYS